MGTTPYDVITDRMVAKLSEGKVPWRKPWNATTDAPRNLDGKLYRGINVWMLMGGASPIWMTFNAAREHGGSVLKGERSTPVVFWKVDKYTAEDEEGNTVIRIPRSRGRCRGEAGSTGPQGCGESAATFHQCYNRAVWVRRIREPDHHGRDGRIAVCTTHVKARQLTRYIGRTGFRREEYKSQPVEPEYQP